MPILKVAAAAVLSRSYPSSKISETRKVNWRRKLKLHATLPLTTLGPTASWILPKRSGVQLNGMLVNAASTPRSLSSVSIKPLR